MYYHPRLPDKRLAPMPWQMRIFFMNANWPLDDHASWFYKLFDKFLLIMEFFSIFLCLQAEYNFLIQNRHDLGLALETLATVLATTECVLRILNMVYKRREFKNFIQEFYGEIYIERTGDNKILYDELHRKSLPTRICSLTYGTTLLTYFIIPFIGLYYNQRVFPYKMDLFYDYHPLPVYIPTLFCCIWAGVNVAVQYIAEANTLAILILNLNGRYLILQRDLRELYSKIQQQNVAPDLIVPKFREELVKIIQRNIKLNQFARQMQEQFSFRIFVMMGLSALLLCALGFKMFTLGMDSRNITYLCWVSTKTVELVVFGELGSTFMETTDQMSASYYLCNWEQVIQDSGNTKENVQIMKLISIAIELNQQKIYLSGLNFFRVNLSSVITILRGALSYFTFLYAFY